jgi:hypothetical protein
MDVTVTGPSLIDQELFSMWLLGTSVEDAVEVVTKATFDQFQQGDVQDQRQLSRLRDCIASDVQDQYSLFEIARTYLIDKSKYLGNANRVQFIGADLHRQLIEKYYSFDEDVIRTLLGKKMSAKDRKELDEYAERSATRAASGSLKKSCQRQFENLARIRSMWCAFCPGLFRN